MGGRMQVEVRPPGRIDHGAFLDCPSAHHPTASPSPRLSRNPAATLATSPRRGFASVRRWAYGHLHCPVARSSRQHHLCRPFRLRTPRSALSPVGSSPGSAPTFDVSTVQSHLAFGRAVTPSVRLAVRTLVIVQTSCLSDPTTFGEGHQPRAPPKGTQKRGFSLRRVRRKLLSNDPQRSAILRRLKGFWQHRQRGCLLAFFDVQPITVKAYGGRRYTREAQLILSAKQKTRGRFYLFVLYEVNHGWTHWAFFAGKGARYVCQFMRRVRRWYPTQPLRVALDQDPAHPCKAKQTKRLMRQLGLRWTSLPKGSPDDNPVETIFSDVQQAILDNSNDPNATATQQRISNHLRSRNRRKDRFFRISYLGIAPNNR